MSYSLATLDRLTQKLVQDGTSLFIRTFDGATQVHEFEFTGLVPGAPIPTEVHDVARDIRVGLARNTAHLTTTPSGGVAILGPDGSPIWFSDHIDPRTYGCAGDGQLVFDANVVLSGGTTYNISSATANGGVGFTPQDIGKLIAVMNSNPASTSDIVKSGTITAIVNTNQAQVNLGGAPGGTLTNMRCVFGTDDTTNFNTAVTYAGQQKRPLKITAIYCVSNLATLPDDFIMFGEGPDPTRHWPYDVPYNGGAIVCAKWPGNTSPMIVAGFGSGFYNITIDGFANCATTIDFSQHLGKGTIRDSMIMSGYTRNIACGPTTNIRDSALWMHRSASGYNVEVTAGDTRIVNCDIAGSGNTKYQMLITSGEVQVAHCHLWKDSGLIASSRADGGQILVIPSTDKFYGLDLVDNIYDTSVGSAYAHVAFDLSNAAATNAYDVHISGGRMLQPGTAGNIPAVKLSIPVGKALRGFSVTGLRGVADFNITENAKYTYLVDGSGVAGNIYGSTTGGCNVMDCAALYNHSATWTAWDKDYGNVILPTYASTTPTVS